MLLSLLRLVVSAVAVLWMAMNAALLMAAASSGGRVAALAAILLGLAILFAMLGCDRDSRRFRRPTVIAFGACLVVAAFALIATPSGQAAKGARVQHRYVGGHDGFRRYAIGNIVPEVDQFAFGFWLVPMADPLFTRKQARVVSRLTASIYAELEAEANFHALGSVMPEAYDEVWRRPFDRGHYFLYVPPSLDRTTPHSALVFLHGSGGNFKAYTWLLSKVVDELGMVLIAPSYGMGNWHEPDTTRVVQAALDDAGTVVALDSQSVHLIGLSNGGLATSQAGRNLAVAPRSLTFLSPVFDLEAISDPTWAGRWQGRPILVVGGREDDRVSIFRPHRSRPHDAGRRAGDL